MKKKIFIALVSAMAATLAVSASAGYVDYTEQPRFEVQKIADDVTWAADGVFTPGEYTVIETKSAWISAAVNNDDNMEAALSLDYTFAMSWDEEYVYTYIQFLDTNGHSNLWGEDPGSMWYSGAMQLGFSEVYTKGDHRLEYGIGRTSDTDKLISHVWSDYMDSDYTAPTEDFMVTVDENNMVTYEVRTPYTAFSEVPAGNNAQYSMSFAIVWGNEQDYIHTQLGAGITGGHGKDADCFADIILVDPDAAVQPADSTEIQKGTPIVDGVLDIDYRFSAAQSLSNIGFYAWGGADTFDVAATAYFLWDDEYLYICTEVTDSHLVDVGADTYVNNPTTWRADCVEAWMDEGNGIYKTHADAFGHSFFAQANPGTPSFSMNDVLYAATQSDTGYVVEYAMPFAKLGNGEQFQYSLQVNDLVTADAGYSSGYQTSDITMTMVDPNAEPAPEPNPDVPNTNYVGCAEPNIQFDVLRMDTDTTWVPDGIMAAGEYTIIDTKPEWLSAYVDNPANIQAAMDLDYTLAMSWDDNYVYTYIQYTDPNGHDNQWADEPGNIWQSGGIQIGFSEAGQAKRNLLEYGIGITSGDNPQLIDTIWMDYLGSTEIQDGDYIVTNNNGTLTYEFRTPYYNFSHIFPADDVKYGCCFVLSWGNGTNDLIHTSIAAGITGESAKNADMFAEITLQDPNADDRYGVINDYFHDSAVRDIEFTVQKIDENVGWTPDGDFTPGEYTEIDVNPDWISAAVNAPENLNAARNLEHTLAMSWDSEYVYTYLQYVDIDGHFNIWEKNPGNMWLSGGVQLAFSDYGQVDDYRLEYGVGLTSDTNAQIATVWSEYMESISLTAGEDYFVTCETDTATGYDIVTYETRTPISTFSSIVPRNGAQYGMSYVLSWGNGTETDINYSNTQLGAGISGAPGKDAARFAAITLAGSTNDTDGPDTPGGGDDGNEPEPGYPAYVDCATQDIRFDIEKIAENTTWNPNGVMDDGEYTTINVDPSWYSAYAPSSATMDTALTLPYTLGMSWDEEYVYTYVSYEDPNGHDNLWGDEPHNMWQSGALQINFSEPFESGHNRLEYGIGLTSDTGELITNVWADYMASGYNASGDFYITNNNDTLTYEFRTPISAFSGLTPNHGMEYGFCLVISWGNGADMIHTQLAAGCTGDPGKDAARFAKVKLVAPDVPETPETPATDFDYTITENNTVMITGYKGNGGLVFVPAEIEGYPVTAIDGWAFRSAKLTALTIPDTITSWGSNVVLWNNDLQSINVNGENGNFFSDDGVLMERTANGSVSLRAYPNGRDETYYNVPDYVTTIGDYAFFAVTSLDELHFEGSITAVGTQAFGEMDMNGWMYIPENFPLLTYNHCGATAVGGVEVAENNPNMTAVDGVLYSKDMKTLIIYPTNVWYATSFTIPEGVEEIPGTMLYLQHRLQSLTLSSTVSKIHTSTLYTTSSLTEIHVAPGNSKFAAQDGVLYNADLTKLICYPSSKPDKTYVFPETLQSVEYMAAYSCINLEKISFPAGFNSINFHSFLDCRNLQAAYFLGNAPTCKYYNYQTATPFNGTASNFTIYHTANATGWDTLNWVCNGSAYATAVFNPDAPIDGIAWNFDESTGTLTIYGGGAMDDYSHNNRAPWYTHAYDVQHVVIEEGVTSIGKMAFDSFYNLDSMSLPSTLTTIADDFAQRCNGFTDLTIADGNPVFFTENSVLFAHLGNGDTKLIRYPSGLGVVSYTVPNHVVEIGSYAFEGTMFENLTLSARSVTTASDSFSYATVNGTFTISGNIIGDESCFDYISTSYFVVADSNSTFKAVDGVLFNKDMTKLLVYPELNPSTSYTIPDGVTFINKSLLKTSRSLQTINIPASVTEFSAYGNTVTYCTVENINVAADNPVYSSVDGVLFNKAQTELILYPIGKSNDSYTMPTTVNTVKSYAFQYNTKLKKLFVSGNVTTLESYSIEIETLRNLKGIYFLGDIPTSYTYNNYSRPFGYLYEGMYNVPMLYFVDGMGYGWTAPYWTDCNGFTFNTAVYNPDAPTEEGITWNYDENTRTLTISGYGPMDNYDWDNRAPWYDCNRARHLVVEEGVTSIGEMAFDDFYRLESISLPFTLSTIADDFALSGFSGLTTITVADGNPAFFTENNVLFKRLLNGDSRLIMYLNSQVVDYTVPSHVSEIAEYAFKNANFNNFTLSARSITLTSDSLAQIRVHGTFTIVGNINYSSDFCFEYVDTSYYVVADDHPTLKAVDGVLFNKNMTKLLSYPMLKQDTSYTIPDGVTFTYLEIITSAPYLKHITIPASVMEIYEYGSFGNECALESITVAADNPVYSSVDGVLYNKAQTELICYPISKPGTAFTIPSTGTTIKSSSFIFNDYLEKLYIGANVTNIEDYSLEIDSLTNLKGIYFLGDVPASYNSYENYRPFGYLDSSSDVPTLYFVDGMGYGWTTPTWTDCTGFTFNTATFVPGEETPDVSDFEYVTNSNGGITITKYIGTGGDVVIPDTIDGLPVTLIASSAFSFNWELGDVYIPASVTAIHEFAFYQCGVTSYTVDPSSTSYQSVDGVLMEYGTSDVMLIAYPASKTNVSYTIPAFVNEIAAYAFAFTQLLDLTVPDTVTVLPSTALNNISISGTLSLSASVQITDSSHYRTLATTHIANISLDAANPYMIMVDHVLYTKDVSEIIIYPNANAAETYEVPNTVASISNTLLLCQSNLKHLILPASVVEIYDARGFRANSLVSITVAEDNPVFSSQDGVLFDKNKTTLIHYPAHKTDVSYVVPNTVTAIQGGAFCYNLYLESVTLPAGLTNLETGAFTYTRNLHTAYFHSDAPMVSRNWFGGIFNDPAEDFTLYYLEGKSGWTSPTWTDGFDKTYTTATFVPSETPDTPENDKLVIPDNADCKLEPSTDGNTTLLTGLFTDNGGNTVSALKAVFADAAFITVVDKNGRTLADDECIGTGAQIRLTDGNGNVLDRATAIVNGDLDGDGSTNAADRITLSRYIAGWNTEKLDAYALAACDINGDGYVTAKDRVIMSRHVANWSGYKVLRDWFMAE